VTDDKDVKKDDDDGDIRTSEKESTKSERKICTNKKSNKIEQLKKKIVFDDIESIKIERV
jgi:hypothetical protein